MKASLLFCAATLWVTASHAARAQGAPDCQTIMNDVTVTDPHAFMPQNDVGGAELGGRTSGQVLARWATVQDRDPEACTTLNLVQRRLATEAQAAGTRCPDVAAVVRQRIEVANGEAAVVCGHKQE